MPEADRTVGSSRLTELKNPLRPSDKRFRGRAGNNVDVSAGDVARAAGGADDSKFAVAKDDAADDAPIEFVLSNLFFDEAPIDLFFFAFVALRTVGFDTPLVISEEAE